MSKIPTAEKLIEKEDSISYGFEYENTSAIDTKIVKKLMIEFAKLHVKKFAENNNLKEIGDRYSEKEIK